MATNKKKTISVIGVIAAAGLAFLGYTYWKRKKAQQSSGDVTSGDESGSSSSSASPATTTVSTTVVKGAVPPKYIENADLSLQNGSYGRKIAKLQYFINMIKPNSVKVDGSLGGGTRAKFDEIAEIVRKKTNVKPKLSQKTIDNIEALAVKGFGFQNIMSGLNSNSDYVKVTQKYTA